MTKNKNLLLLISVILVFVLLCGMILSIVFLSGRKNAEWEHFVDDKGLEYYSDENELAFSYVTEFSSALQNYFSNSTLKFLGLDKNVQQLTDRVITAMQDARIPAIRLKTIATVINEHKLPTLLSGITIPAETLEEFTLWLDTLTISASKQSMFSLLSGFINSFLEVTTLSEDELSGFIYAYLYRYGSDKYRLTLDLYGKERFISFFSDTLFAIRTINRTTDSKGISVSMEALRSSLYQLGKFYIDISKITEIEKLFGFPETIPTEKYPYSAEFMQENYKKAYGTTTHILRYLGYLLSSFTKEQLQAYLEYKNFVSDNYTELAMYSILKEQGLLSESQEKKMKTLTDKQDRLHIYASQCLTKALLNGFSQYSNEPYADVIDRLKSNLISLRYIISITSNDTMNENFTKYNDLIVKDSENFIKALEYFSQFNYSYRDIEKMKDITLPTKNASMLDAGSELMELYSSSLFNIWLTYKANEWGLLKNE